MASHLPHVVSELEPAKPNAVQGGVTPSAQDTPLSALLNRALPDRLPVPPADYGSGVVIASVAKVQAGTVFVRLPQGGEPVAAQSLCALTPDDAGRLCAVLFAQGDPAHPLVVGCLVEAAPVPDAVLAPDSEPHQASKTLRVDGKRVIIEAHDELELRCGESIILMQRDGVIEIRGNYVTSQATATQRIRGGSVHVN